jgi:hypothetical protein
MKKEHRIRIARIALSMLAYALSFNGTTATAGVNISGNISDSIDGTPIKSAMATLTVAVAGSEIVVDSAFSNASGTYTFTNVQAGVYDLSAAIWPYSKQTYAIKVLASPIIQNFRLVKLTYYTLKGRVTSDSAGGPPIKNAKITMSRPGGGTVYTAWSDSLGRYELHANDSIVQSATYNVGASATGFTNNNRSNGVLFDNYSGGIKTRNIILDRIPLGSLFVIVRKQADSTPVAGATIFFRKNRSASDVIIDSTDNSGIAVFEGTAAGTQCGITAFAAGFTPGCSELRLFQNGSDTISMYLVAEPFGGSKIVQGKAFDSKDGAALAQAKIMLSIQVSSSGKLMTLISFTDANGNFSISGIPVQYTSGILYSMLDSYNFFQIQITMGSVTIADTTKVNVSMTKATTEIIPNVKVQPDRNKPDFSTTPAGVLCFNNFTDNGIIEVFALDGKRMFRGAFTGNTISYSLPQTIASHGNACIISVTQQNTRICKQAIITK